MQNIKYIDIDNEIIQRKDIKFIHNGLVYEIVGLGTEGLRNNSTMIKLELHLRRTNIDNDY